MAAISTPNGAIPQTDWDNYYRDIAYPEAQREIYAKNSKEAQNHCTNHLLAIGMLINSIILILATVGVGNDITAGLCIGSGVISLFAWLKSIHINGRNIYNSLEVVCSIVILTLGILNLPGVDVLTNKELIFGILGQRIGCLFIFSIARHFLFFKRVENEINQLATAKTEQHFAHPAHDSATRRPS